jgi:CRISPR-associated protein Csx10
MNALTGEFDVRLRFLSDWHVGTGAGRVGSVDAVVRRDADGLPFVPAKTLIGVWRDACETIAATLDGGGTGPCLWSTWVEWLFGSQPGQPADVTAAQGRAPARATLQVGPARMPAGLRAALRDKPALRDAAVLLRPGVKLDVDTGTTVEDMLRVEERALRGALLEATVTVTGHEVALPAPAELLLRAGARLVEAVGGKRNRGAGRLVLLLPGVADPWIAGTGPAGPAADPPPDTRLVSLLADTALLDAPGTPPPAPGATAPVLARGRRAGSSRTWRLELEVVTPVVVVDRVVGNNITTREELAGTALLPAVLQRLPAGVAVGLGDVRVGDAVPAGIGPDGTAYPGYATPLVWHRTD